jgi:hypothetical protein
MPYVSDVIYQLTKGVNWLGGGDEWRSPVYTIDKDGKIVDKQGWRTMFDWNPSVIEHLLEGYTGGVGQEINNTAKLIISAAKKLEGDHRQRFTPATYLYCAGFTVPHRVAIRGENTSTSKQRWMITNISPTNIRMKTRLRCSKPCTETGK